MGKAGRRRWALLLISQRCCTVQRQTSLCSRQPEPQPLLTLALELCVSLLRSNPDMLLTHFPSLPTDLPLPGVAALSQAQQRHREGWTADWPLGWGKMLLWSLGKAFCSIGRKAAMSHVLCQGCALISQGAVGSQPGPVCPSAITQLYCSSTNTQPGAPLAGCGSTAGAAPL